MPPPLALLLCSVFVLFLLRFDRQKSPDVSWASWLPTLWLFAIGTKPIGVWFSSTSGDESASPLDQFFFTAIMCLGLAILIRRQFDWRGTFRSQRWLIALVAYMLLSLLWAELPFTCFKRGIRQVVAVIMAFVVLSERDPRQTLECILRRMAYVLVPFSILLIKYYPHFGIQFGRWSGDRMWVGVAQQKNGLGRVCIVVILFLAWTLVRRWRGSDVSIGRRHTQAELVVLTMALYLLLNPEGKSSATSIVALFMAAVGYVGLEWLERHGRRIGARLLTVMVLGLVAFGIGLPFSGGSIGSGMNEAIGRDATFTGRADAWIELVPIAMGHPILGCGFDSYWTPATRELHEMSHAHCSYLEVFNELGAVGLLLFAMFMVSVVRNAQRSLAFDFDWGCFCICYILMVLLHGATESSINSFTNLLAGVVLLLSVSFASESSPARNAAQAGQLRS